MNHPDDLLVDLVDGSIPSADRDAVEAHVASCARCAQEVALASAGREALRRLEPPEVPVGLADAAILEAEHRALALAPVVTPLRRGRLSEAPAWYRWAGAAAAAAIGLLVVAVLPNVGNDGEQDVIEAAADRGWDTAAAAELEIQDADYDVPEVQDLAVSFRSAFQASAGATAGASLGAESAPAVPVAGDAEAVDPQQARDCLGAAVPEVTEQPVRLIAARFQGVPAYLGVYLSGPGAQQPPDTATVWVVARDDCRILTTTTASL
jgi:hypothetical protein